MLAHGSAGASIDLQLSCTDVSAGLANSRPAISYRLEDVRFITDG